MSEAVVEDQTMQGEGAAPAQATAGALLRQAREAARIQLSVMAATLKVPQRKLEALEADDYAAFPDHVFMRALAMSMCRTLHIEAEPVLAQLPHREIKSLAKTGPGINEAVKVSRHFKGGGVPLHSGSHSTRKIAAGVLILLAAAAAVYFVPFHPVEGGAASASGESVTTPVPSQAGEVPSPSAQVAQPAAPEAQGLPAAAVTQEPAPASASVPEQAPVVEAGASAAPMGAGDSASSVPLAGGAAGLLVLKASSGQSWVKVKDGAGKVVLEKTLNQEESATAEGQLPLSVIVGNAKGTQVTVRGEPFDISTTRDNVARFEVK